MRHVAVFACTFIVTFALGIIIVEWAVYKAYANEERQVSNG